MSLKQRYKTINNSNFRPSKVKNLIKDKNDPRIKKLEKLKGWKWSNKIIFPTFELATNIARKMNVSNYKAYCEELRKDNPYNLPFKPFSTYKKNWISTYDYFGKKGESNIEKSKSKFSYNEAIKFIAKNCKGKVLSMGDFNKWKNDDLQGVLKFPKKMPKNPAASYKKDWVSSFHFFGKPNKIIIKETYPHTKFKKISYSELKIICQENNLQTRTECRNWLFDNKDFFNTKGLYAPLKGGESYKEFEGWANFLGKE